MELTLPGCVDSSMNFFLETLLIVSNLLRERIHAGGRVAVSDPVNLPVKNSACPHTPVCG
jgi:hypothetical protein